MKNEIEIKFNCNGLIATWFEKNNDKIDDDSKVSLSMDNCIVHASRNELGSKLFDIIKNPSNKGKKVDFCYNGKVLETFDIN